MTATHDGRCRICGAHFAFVGAVYACPRGCTAQERDAPPMAWHTPYLPQYRLERIRDKHREDLKQMEREGGNGA